MKIFKHFFLFVVVHLFGSVQVMLGSQESSSASAAAASGATEEILDKGKLDFEELKKFVAQRVAAKEQKSTDVGVTAQSTVDARAMAQLKKEVWTDFFDKKVLNTAISKQKIFDDAWELIKQRYCNQYDRMRKQYEQDQVVVVYYNMAKARAVLYQPDMLLSLVNRGIVAYTEQDFYINPSKIPFINTIVLCVKGYLDIFQVLKSEKVFSDEKSFWYFMDFLKDKSPNFSELLGSQDKNKLIIDVIQAYPKNARLQLLQIERDYQKAEQDRKQEVILQELEKARARAAEEKAACEKLLAQEVARQKEEKEKQVQLVCTVKKTARSNQIVLLKNRFLAWSLGSNLKIQIKREAKARESFEKEETFEREVVLPNKIHAEIVASKQQGRSSNLCDIEELKSIQVKLCLCDPSNGVVAPSVEDLEKKEAIRLAKIERRRGIALYKALIKEKFERYPSIPLKTVIDQRNKLSEMRWKYDLSAFGSYFGLWQKKLDLAKKDVVVAIEHKQMVDKKSVLQRWKEKLQIVLEKRQEEQAAVAELERRQKLEQEEAAAKCHCQTLKQWEQEAFNYGRQLWQNDWDGAQKDSNQVMNNPSLGWRHYSYGRYVNWQLDYPLGQRRAGSNNYW